MWLLMVKCWMLSSYPIRCKSLSSWKAKHAEYTPPSADSVAVCETVFSEFRSAASVWAVQQWCETLDTELQAGRQRFLQFPAVTITGKTSNATHEDTHVQHTSFICYTLEGRIHDGPSGGSLWLVVHVFVVVWHCSFYFRQASVCLFDS